MYIGQTIGTMEKRWGEHKSTGRNCTALKRAMDKYGINNFSIELIQTADSITELNLLEEFTIMLYNTRTPNGYNIKAGGDNHKMTEDTKRLLSIAKSGISLGPMKEETKYKISQSLKGKNIGKPSPFKDQYASPKQQAGIDLYWSTHENHMKGKVGYNLGLKFNDEHCNMIAVKHGAKPFYAIDKNNEIIGEFLSMSIAARETGINRSTIIRQLHKELKTKPYKIRFVYKDE